jgi:hypothetical protein
MPYSVRRCKCFAKYKKSLPGLGGINEYDFNEDHSKTFAGFLLREIAQPTANNRSAPTANEPIFA